MCLDNDYTLTKTTLKGPPYLRQPEPVIYIYSYIHCPGRECLEAQAEVHGLQGELPEVPQSPHRVPPAPAWDQASERQEVPRDPCSTQG